MTDQFSKSHNVVAIIPARGGSKGVPQKNLRYFNGKPLIVHAISLAQESNIFSRIIVNTDDDEIASIARNSGCEIFERSLEAASDRATVDDVIAEMFPFLLNSEVVNFATIQPTVPLLSPQSIKGGFERFSESSYDTIISVVEDTHLYWEQDTNGEMVPSQLERKNRQEMPKKFKETGGFVFFKLENLKKQNSRFGQKVGIYEVPANEAIDIDALEHFAMAEAVNRIKKICFRVCGNNTLGLGHFYNSLDIIRRFAGYGITVSAPIGSELVARCFREKNFECEVLSDEDFISFVQSGKPDLVLLDCLDTDSAFVRALKDTGSKVVSFEDMGDGNKITDLTINAIYQPDESSPNIKSGYKYFILRNEFFRFKKQHRRVRVNNETIKLCVLFGGVDPNNLTKRVVGLLANDEFKNIEVEVILGKGYGRDRALQLPESDNINYIENCQDVADRLWKANIVVSSAGRTVFEIMALNKPCVVICQNEREERHIFCSNQKIMNLGLFSRVSQEAIRSAILEIIASHADESDFFYPEAEYIWDGGKTVVNLLEKEMLDE